MAEELCRLLLFLISSCCFTCTSEDYSRSSFPHILKPLCPASLYCWFVHSGQGNRTFPQGSFHTSGVYSQLLVTSFQRSGSQLDGETRQTHNEEEARAAWWPSWTPELLKQRFLDDSPRCLPCHLWLHCFLHTSSCESVQTALLFGHCAFFSSLQQLQKRIFVPPATWES